MKKGLKSLSKTSLFRYSRRLVNTMPEDIDFTMSAPPSARDTSSDPNRTLYWLQQRIKTIYSASNPGVSLKDSMAIHAAASDYCRTLTKGPHGGHLLGEDLYRVVEESVGQYCETVSARLLQVFSSLSQVHENGERQQGVLEAYTTQWKIFRNLSRRVSHLLTDLDKRWIKREIAESTSANGQATIYCIEDLHRKLWMEKLLNLHNNLGLLEKLNQAVESQLVINGRSGAAIELIEGIRTFFLGLDSQDVDEMLERLRLSTSGLS